MAQGIPVATAFVDIIPQAADFATQAQSQVQGQAAQLGTQAGETMSRSWGDAMGNIGKRLTTTLTPAAAGAGLALKSIGDDWNDAVREIRVGTGATGDALNDLLGSAKTLGGQVPNDFGDISVAVGDLNTALGLTGEPLEGLGRQFLDLSRITGTDVSTNIAKVTRAFGDWGVATQDQPAFLEKLFAASQATGSSVDELASRVVQFGAPMRSMGFSIDETTALLGLFEKTGVNTELVMGSMRQALTNFAREGQDAPTALRELIDEIQNIESDTDAAARAMEVFGARAGPDMADTIRGGKFEIDELIDSIANSEDSIAAAAEDTLTLSDRFKMLQNRVTGALGPYGEMGSLIAGGAASIGPALLGFSQMATVLPRVTTAMRALNVTLLANPWVLIAAAVIALAIIIVRNWDTIVAALGAAWDWITSTAASVGNWLKDRFFDAVDFVKNLFLNFTGPGLLLKHWDSIRKGVSSLVRFVQDKFSSMIRFVTGLPGRIRSAAAGMWNGITDAFRNAINSLIRGWNSLSFKLPSFAGLKVAGRTIIPGFEGPTLRVPKIPQLQTGGITTEEGLIGAHPDEAILPLEELHSLVRSAVRAGVAMAAGGERLVIDPSGADRRFLEFLRNLIRVESGGDVQAALGQQ